MGSDNETKIIDLAKMIIKVTGSTSTIVQKEMPPDDPLRRAADVSKIKKLGWHQEIRLEEGLKIMFENLK